MHIAEQRVTLIEASQQARIDLDSFISFLRESPKFQGQGDDWIRTGEVWPVLREVINNLRVAVDKIQESTTLRS
jgi:hypothetical protein